MDLRKWIPCQMRPLKASLSSWSALVNSRVEPVTVDATSKSMSDPKR